MASSAFGDGEKRLSWLVLRLRGVFVGVPRHLGLQVVDFPLDGRQLLIEVGQPGPAGSVERVQKVRDPLDRPSNQLDVFTCVENAIFQSNEDCNAGFIFV